VLRRLVALAEETPRPYRFVILSDHGQSMGSTFLQRYGERLEDVLTRLMGGGVSVQGATGNAEDYSTANAIMSESVTLPGRKGRIARRVLRKRMTDSGGAVAERGRTPAVAQPELVVCASGNLALVYFPRHPGRMAREEIEAAWPGLLEGLAAHPGVGFLMVRSAADGPVALGADGMHVLGSGAVTGSDPLHRFGTHAADDLSRMDAMEHCPDIVVNSFLDPDTDEVAAFEELIGCHGGLGGWQTRGFIVYPGDWSRPVTPIIGAENVYVQLRTWLDAVGVGPGNLPPLAADAGEAPDAAGADASASPGARTAA